MTLAPFQLSFNGLTFGAGCDVQLVSATGLREAPPTRGSDQAKPRLHGAFAGRTLFASRIVTLTLGVSVTVAGFEQVLAGMAAAFANITDPAGLLPLQFNLSAAWATPRQVVGRPTKVGYPIDLDYQAQKLKAIPVQLDCTDPLIYDTAVQQVSTGLPSPTAGLSFPAAAPFAFGASAGGSLRLGNTGNEAIGPVFTITGPVTWPQLTIGGAALGLQITLAAGDSLVIDCRARTVVLNGTASRLNTLMTGSQWLAVPPGGAVVGFSSVDATQVTGQLSAACPAGGWGLC